MCEFPSGYKFPDGSVKFHTDDDVQAAWEKAGNTQPIDWNDIVGHAGWRFCFGNPPDGAVEIEASKAFPAFLQQNLFSKTKKLLSASRSLDLSGLTAIHPSVDLSKFKYSVIAPNLHQKSKR